jgi:hypothetical protein
MYAKIGAIVLGIVLLFGSGYHFGGLASKTKLEALQAANALSLANDYKQREADHIAKEKALGLENDQLKDNALKFPTVAVRVCHLAPAVPAPGKGGQVVSTGPGVGTADPQPVPASSGPDLGPVLFGLADALDQIAAKCRAL